MPDTHDERGGDEAAVRIAAMLKAYREYDDDQPVEIVHSGLYLTIGDVRGLVRDRDQLAAATARAEKAEALVAGLHEEWGYRFGVGCGEDGFDSETTARLIAAPGDRIVHRLVGEWRGAPDAAQDGLSATETDADGVQGSADGRTPVRASAGPSEACGNKYGYHVCFLPAEHDGDHRDGLNWTWTTHLGTWPNGDTTEGRP